MCVHMEWRYLRNEELCKGPQIKKDHIDRLCNTRG